MSSTYFQRIGAIAQGAGKYRVSQGYDGVTLIVHEGGKLEIPEGIEPPTQEELAYIEKNHESLRSVVAPITPVPPGAGLPPSEGHLHEYRDPKGRLLFCVDRVVFETPKGMDKKCIPWLWNGAKWEEQAWPEEIPCPLYGDYSRRRVMIHEGEKAVDAAEAAAKPDSGHPWQSFLARFGHVSWRAGTRMVNRADWSLISDNAEVWIMPDNDAEGFKAARWVAEEIMKARPTVKNIMMLHYRDGMVPKRWDIADEPFDVPVTKLEAAFQFEMPGIEYIMRGDKPIPVLRKSFVQSFVYMRGTDEFVLGCRPRHFYKSTNLRAAYGHLCPGVGTWVSMLADSKHLPKVDLPGYIPTGSVDHRSNIWHPPPKQPKVNDSGLAVFNTYLPPLVEERRPSGLSDIKPFIVMMRNLIPNPRERKILIRWSASVVSGRRLRWAPLLVSKMEGTGKTTYARTLSALVGAGNTSQINSAVLQEKYNGWAEGVQLVIVPELKEAGTSGFKLAEHLKVLIDDDTIPVRRMNVDTYSIDSNVSFVFSSNNPDCVRLSDTDRRWFVPKVTEEVPPHVGTEPKLKALASRYLDIGKDARDASFIGAYIDWRASKEGVLLYLARRYGQALDERGWRGENAKAPDTQEKQELQLSSRPAWIQALDDLLEGVEVFIEKDLIDYLKESDVGWVPKPKEFEAEMNVLGYWVQYKNPDSPDPKLRRGAILVGSHEGKQVRSRVYARESLGAPGSWAVQRRSLNVQMFTSPFVGMGNSDAWDGVSDAM